MFSDWYHTDTSICMSIYMFLYESFHSLSRGSVQTTSFKILENTLLHLQQNTHQSKWLCWSKHSNTVFTVNFYLVFRKQCITGSIINNDYPFYLCTFTFYSWKSTMIWVFHQFLKLLKPPFLIILKGHWSDWSYYTNVTTYENTDDPSGFYILNKLWMLKVSSDSTNQWLENCLQVTGHPSG